MGVEGREGGREREEEKTGGMTMPLVNSSSFLRVVTEVRLGKGWGKRSKKRWEKVRGRGGGCET